MDFNGFQGILLGFTGSNYAYTGCYQSLLGFTGFYWVLLGLSRLLGNSAGLDYVAVIEPAGNVASHDVT